jgi:hypothetical protein
MTRDTGNGNMIPIFDIFDVVRESVRLGLSLQNLFVCTQSPPAQFHSMLASHSTRSSVRLASKLKSTSTKVETPTPSGSKKRKRTPSQPVESDSDFEARPAVKKAGKPRPEPVFVIPDVERKETTFKGRLGK